MESLVTGDLTIDVREDAGVVRVEWKGKSNHRQPELVLAPFFGRIVNAAELKGQTIDMRFQRLEFFNSSTITAIIQLVKELRTKKVKLILAYNKAHKWQKIFFDALEMFQKDDGLLKIVPT